MAVPFVIATNGIGIPVTEAPNGLPYEIAANGFGTPVVFVPTGGTPVTGVGVAVWILLTGFWNDNGRWNDAATWID